MYNSFSKHAHESIADLGEDLDCLVFWDKAFPIHKPPELSPIAILLDNIIEVGGFHNLEAAHNILALEGFQYLNFGVDRLLDVVILVDWIKVGVLVFLESILTATLRLVESCSPR